MIEHPLTKEDIKVLRGHNRSIVARWHESAFGLSEWRGHKLELIRDWGGEDRYYISTQARVTDYAKASDEAYDALVHVFHPSPEWATLVADLRVGDVLTLGWVLHNNCDLLRDAGLTQHELVVTVKRVKGAKDGCDQFTYRSYLVDKWTEKWSFPMTLSKDGHIPVPAAPQKALYAESLA